MRGLDRRQIRSMRAGGQQAGATGGAAVGTVYFGPAGGVVGGYVGGKLGEGVEGFFSGDKDCDAEQPGDEQRCGSKRAIADIRATAARARQDIDERYPGSDLVSQLTREAGHKAISCAERAMFIDCQEKGYRDPIPHIHAPAGDAFALTAGQIAGFARATDQAAATPATRAAVGGGVGAALGAGLGAATLLATGGKIASMAGAKRAGIGAGVGLALGAALGFLTGK